MGVVATTIIVVIPEIDKLFLVLFCFSNRDSLCSPGIHHLPPKYHHVKVYAAMLGPAVSKMASEIKKPDITKITLKKNKDLSNVCQIIVINKLWNRC